MKINKNFDVLHNLGIKNLIVSGCSFTYNFGKDIPTSWPYYLRDLGGFDHVINVASPGAGNNHISNSLQWTLEVNQVDPADSLIIVMWSGNERDDYICPDSFVQNAIWKFNYTNLVSSGMSCGVPPNKGNVNGDQLRAWADTKTPESRAVENYLYSNNLQNYLENNGYRFVFLDYIDRSLPSRTGDFDILPYLPAHLAKKIKKSRLDILPIHNWAMKYGYLDTDDFHPTSDGHLEWTRQVLLPKLQTIIT